MADIGVSFQRILLRTTFAVAAILAVSGSEAQSTAPSVPSSAASAPSAAPATTSSAASGSSASAAASGTRRRRRRRRYVSPQAQTIQQSATSSQTVGLTPAQRERDARILASQQKQSAETARQQAVVTGNVVKERDAQQAEQRIQDAPGPGSQPLPGQPLAAPAQSNDPQGIQDAPGPAQTLPQAPPPAAAPQTTQPQSSQQSTQPQSAQQPAEPQQSDAPQ